MKPPTSFLYNFLKENILFLIDHTIYTKDSSCNNGSYLKANNKKFYFNEGLKLSKLEELYFQNNETELKEYGNNLLKNCLSYEKELGTDYHRLGKEIELAEFVLYNVIKKCEKEDLKIRIINHKDNNRCLIDNIINQDCFVLEGKFYSLNKGKKDHFSIRIHNQDYSIGELLELNLEELEERYLKSIEEKVYKDLTKGKESLANKIEGLNKKKEILDVIKKGEFYDAKEELGIKISDKGFFATTKIRKPYILEEPTTKKRYRFGEALIGVKLTKQEDTIRWNDPVVINPYMHPALPNLELKPYQKICNGKFDYNLAVQGKSLEDSIRILLDEGVRMILKGYYGTQKIDGAWHNLTEKAFQALEAKEFCDKEVTNR